MKPCDFRSQTVWTSIILVSLKSHLSALFLTWPWFKKGYTMNALLCMSVYILYIWAVQAEVKGNQRHFWPLVVLWSNVLMSGSPFCRISAHGFQQPVNSLPLRVQLHLYCHVLKHNPKHTLIQGVNGVDGLFAWSLTFTAEVSFYSVLGGGSPPFPHDNQTSPGIVASWFCCLNGGRLKCCVCHLKCNTLLPSFNLRRGLDSNACVLQLESPGVNSKPFPLVRSDILRAWRRVWLEKQNKKMWAMKWLEEEWLPSNYEKWQSDPKGEIPYTQLCFMIKALVLLKCKEISVKCLVGFLRIWVAFAMMYILIALSHGTHLGKWVVVSKA